MTCRRTLRAPRHGGTPRGASIAANSGQVFDTAYEGDDPASTRTSSRALRAGDGRSATAARPGPVGADPHPEPLRTLQHR
ncbi:MULTISPECIES: hypothetical protein [unclassified Streptomyces]|uniref:hypothetical protein n=1 Tax=unclassified Streptomyces TaxID=2593676 RepID=UPI001EB78FAA|nr:hypothetical protein [Streptomyces sp.]